MTMWLLLAVPALLAMIFVIWRLVLPDRDLGDTPVNDLPLNRTLFDEKLAQLDHQLANSEITGSQYLSLKTEYERQFLADNLALESATASRTRGRAVLLLAALVVPVAAAVIYYPLGAAPEMALRDALQQRSIMLGSGDDSRLEEATDTVFQRLEAVAARHPEMPLYQVMLARLHMDRGEFDAAASRFRRAAEAVPDNGDLRAEYAQALFLAADNRVNDAIARETKLALSLAPDNRLALEMAGIVNFQSGEFAQAIHYWQQALSGVGGQSPDRQALESGIAAARKHLGGDAVAEAAMDEGPRLVVDVSLAGNLNAAPETAVFVYARRWQGPPMPLAVRRLTVAELPARVVLDDSSAMSPAMTLSGADSVEVVARVSFSGSATPSPGDFVGTLGPLDPAEQSSGIDLQITDRIGP